MRKRGDAASYKAAQFAQTQAQWATEDLWTTMVTSPTDDLAIGEANTVAKDARWKAQWSHHRYQQTAHRRGFFSLSHPKQFFVAFSVGVGIILVAIMTIALVGCDPASVPVTTISTPASSAEAPSVWLQNEVTMWEERDENAFPSDVECDVAPTQTAQDVDGATDYVCSVDFTAEATLTGWQSLRITLFPTQQWEIDSTVTTGNP
jgi:hypothetical protein